jgi:hypothetical protein
LGPPVLVMKKLMLGNCGGGCCATTSPANANGASAVMADTAILSFLRMTSPPLARLLDLHVQAPTFAGMAQVNRTTRAE